MTSLQMTCLERAVPKAVRTAMTVAALGSITVTGAKAEEWRNSATLYGLIPWVNTEITGARGNSIESRVTPSDIIDALDFSFMATGEFRRGKLSILYDVMYSDLGQSGTLGGPFAGDASLDVEMWFATAALGYILYEDETRFLQGYGGARFVDISTSAAFEGGGPIGASFDATIDASWVDPVIGLRGRLAISETLAFGGSANVGGFGVGSDLSADVYGGFEYAINDRFSANAGLRYLYIDYEGDNADLVMRQYGPVIGITMRF